MLRAVLLLPLVLLAPISLKTPAADTAGSPAGYHQIKLNGHTFTLPAGFTIELAAAPPLADRPIVAALDEKGRLYVCDSSGSNAKVTEQMKTKPHRIMRLEDTNGDGVYDKSTAYVPNVMFPEGAMWLSGSLYVAAPPNILKFTDTNDDGKADKEEIWFDGTKVSPTIGGCANDLHGPYLGPDGWIYWTKGGFEKQTYTVTGKPFVTKAAHIFRARPDGTGIEPVMTGGMDNPVDVVFTPSGERIFSCTFLQHPANGKRDGLIHAVYGAVYGKDHAPIYDHPWTSPHLMEPMTHLGPAAPCGLHRYKSDQFGKDYENNLFCCQFNLRKVSRHVLVPKGSTFVTKDSDFVVSDQMDFHPTDVIEDADGSLLILDTGGWYKLCCPSSQLVKPDVKGAIYRVKKTGSHKVDDPRGEKIDWAKLKPDELVKLLDDPRPAVWWRAIHEIARKGEQASKAILRLVVDKEASPRVRLGAVWSMARTEGAWTQVANRGFIQEALGDVRQAAIHVASLRRDEASLEALQAVLSDQPASLASGKDRRLAAEALGRIGDTAALPTVQAALIDPGNDAALNHAIRFALIEMNAPRATAATLSHKSYRLRQAGLIALDQMPNGKLDPKHVLAELDSPEAALRETAWWIAGRHPEWGDHLVKYFSQKLEENKFPEPADSREFVNRFASFARNKEIQKLLTNILKKRNSGTAYAVIERAGIKETPIEWLDAFVPKIGGDAGETYDVIHVLRVLPHPKVPHPKLTQALLGFAEDEENNIARLRAIPVLHPSVAKLNARNFKEALAVADGQKPEELRELAVDALASANLSAEQLTLLAPALKKASPLNLSRLISAFAKSTDEKVGLALVAGLMETPVRVEIVKPILDKYPAAVQTAAEKLYAKLAEARKDDIAKLERLVKELPAGDIRRGQAVFNGAKAQCAACHKIGYVGGLVGPDLTRIGGIRTERDLLESIVFPSASFVRSYEPVRVTTKSDRVLSGIVKNETPDAIVLAIAADKEERIDRSDVESVTPGTVSVMPDGLEKQLTLQELADLVAFLKANK